MNRFNSMKGGTIDPDRPCDHVLFDVLMARAGRGDRAEGDGLANTTVLIPARQSATHFRAGLSARLLLSGAAQNLLTYLLRSPEQLYTHRQLPRCLLYTSPSPRDLSTSRMPSSA